MSPISLKAWRWRAVDIGMNAVRTLARLTGRTIPAGHYEALTAAHAALSAAAVLEGAFHGPDTAGVMLARRFAAYGL